MVVAVGASRAAVGGVLGHLVGLAPQVPLRGALIVARPVSGPVPRTVHRLRTARGRARGRHVAVGAARAAVRGAPGVLVVSAPPVGASGLVAPAVGAPRSGAVHRLGATRGGAGVLTVAVPAASSTIGGVGRVNVLAALPVLAARLVAPAVRRPVPGTVHGLGAPRLSAILVPVAVGASGPTVRSGGGVHVVPALLAAAAGPEARPVPRAVRCLGAAAGGALSVPVAVGATGTSVRGGGGVHVVPALLAAGAAPVARPVPRAVLGLWAAAGGALGLPGSRAQQAPTRGLRLLVPEFGVVHGRLLQGAPWSSKGIPVPRAVIVPPRKIDRAQIDTTKPTVPSSVRAGCRQAGGGFPGRGDVRFRRHVGGRVQTAPLAVLARAVRPPVPRALELPPGALDLDLVLGRRDPAERAREGGQGDDEEDGQDPDPPPPRARSLGATHTFPFLPRSQRFEQRKNQVPF